MGAERGTLAIMSGGSKEDFERALPIFKAMSTNQFYCGEIGTGIIAKLTNNLILFINSLAATECLNMGITYVQFNLFNKSNENKKELKKN